jgi:hypothetical protein
VLGETQEPSGSAAMEDEVSARLRGFRAQAFSLLPGAVALLAFQVFGLLHPSPASLAALPHFVLLSSTMWAAVSVLLLTYLHSRRTIPRVAQRAEQLVRPFDWTLTFALGALLVGASSDVFVAVHIASGSLTLSAAITGALIALGAWICW